MSNIKTGEIVKLDGTGTPLAVALYRAGVRAVSFGERFAGKPRTASIALPKTSIIGGCSMPEDRWDEFVAYVKAGGRTDPYTWFIKAEARAGEMRADDYPAIAEDGQPFRRGWGVER